MEKSLFEKALHDATYWLSIQSRTESEIQNKLHAKEHEACIVDEVCAYLKAHELIDDQHYAEEYILLRQRKYGLYRLKRGLINKGVNSLTIEKAILSLKDQNELINPYDICAQLMEKKIESLNIDEKRLKEEIAYKYKMMDKLSRFLLSRGFPSTCVKDLVTERLGEHFFSE